MDNLKQNEIESLFLFMSIDDSVLKSLEMWELRELCLNLSVKMHSKTDQTFMC